MSLKCSLITIIKNFQKIWQTMPPEMHALIPTESNKSNLAVFHTRSSNRRPSLSNTPILSYSLRFLTNSSRRRSVNARTSMICRHSQAGFSWISIRRRTFGRSSHHNDGHGLAVHTVRSLHIAPALRVLHGASLPTQQTQLRCQIMLNRRSSSLLCTSSLALPRAPTPRSGLSPSPQSSDPPLSDVKSSHG